VPIPLWSGHVLAMLEEYRAWLTRTPPRITRIWYDALFEDTQLSCAKAREQIGYTITPLRVALEKVISWLSGQAGVSPAGPAPKRGTL
jgi:hypothetical protein